MSLPAPTSRNAPCPCGSGKRYKHCHGVGDNFLETCHSAASIKQTNPVELLTGGLDLEKRGNIEAAEKAYRAVLELDSGHPDAWHLLGQIDLRRGHHEAAIEKFDRAIRFYPDHTAFHLSRIRAEIATQQIEEAVSHCKLLLERKPNEWEAWSMLGLALAGRDFKEAETAFRKAIDLRPTSAAPYFELAQMLVTTGQEATALGVLQQGLEVFPQDPQLRNASGLALERTGRYSEAEQEWLAALQFNSDFGLARANLGRRRLASGNPAEALLLLEPVVPELLDSAEYWLAIGLARQSLGQYEAALSAFTKAQRLRPQDPRLHFNLGWVNFEMSQMDEAHRHFRDALRLQPDMEEAELPLLEISRRRCDWDEYRELIQHLPLWLAHAERLMPPPHSFVSLPVSPTDLRRVAEAYSRSKARGVPTRRFPRSGTSGRLRLGYLTNAAREHPTPSLITEVLERHDKSRVEVFLYSCGPKDGSPYRVRIENAVEHFIDLHLATDAQVAERIGSDNIQVLVDLDGYTQLSRNHILASRPAQVQVNYLGFPGTLGASFCDYIITDRVVTPPESQAHFAERFLYMPHCYLPSDTRRVPKGVSAGRAEHGLPENAFVYCSFNHLYKLLPEMFDVWARILSKVPNSVLWVLAHETIARDNLRREAKSRGVDPSRLIFASPLPQEKHLGRYPLADLFLDTLPCNAHTTCNDALLMGLPVLTCAGSTFAGRVAASHLQAVGLPQLVTTTMAEYETLAAALARNPVQLEAFRQHLVERGRQSPLFDMANYTESLETILMQAFEEPPSPIGNLPRPAA